MPGRWDFRCYVNAKGNDEIRAWYDEQSGKTRAKFFDRLAALRTLPYNEWQPPLFKNLSFDGAGLGEIRFKSDAVQRRPLGFRSANTEFTILLCATEKGDKLIPAWAIQRAQERKKEVQEDADRSCPIFLAFQ